MSAIFAGQRPPKMALILFDMVRLAANEMVVLY